MWAERLPATDPTQPAEALLFGVKAVEFDSLTLPALDKGIAQAYQRIERIRRRHIRPTRPRAGWPLALISINPFPGPLYTSRLCPV
jgi:hypothetical protein